MADPSGSFGSSIQTVKVFTTDVVNGMEFTYVDGSGKIKKYPVGNSAGEPNQFTLDNGEFINVVSGYNKKYHGQSCISQVTFLTNLGKKYGPYGPTGGDPFNVPMVANQIIGFLSLDGQYVNNIATCLPVN